jgi:hypothetical protein
MAGFGQNKKNSMIIHKRNNKQLPHNFEQGLYAMINEFLGKWPLFQPPHMKDLMAYGNGIFKLVGQTPKQSIELNDNFTVLEVKVQYEDLNAINKVYAHNTDETRLYEQPQSTKPFLEHVNMPNSSTPLKPHQ